MTQPAAASLEAWMLEALSLAEQAESVAEVPVGAVVVHDGAIVGRGFNSPILKRDPTAHAEILALRDAASVLQNYRLTGGVLVCTMEPCLMCMGAAIHARISNVVYGASDPKVGATQRVISLADQGAIFNHRIEIQGGILEAECQALLKRFFRARREG